MAKASEPVVVTLEDVAVDRAEFHALALGVRSEFSPVVDRVPYNVNGNGWAGSGQPMDECSVGNSLVHGSRRAGPGNDAEARPRVPVTPRGRLDPELAKTRNDGVDIVLAVETGRTHEGMIDSRLAAAVSSKEALLSPKPRAISRASNRSSRS